MPTSVALPYPRVPVSASPRLSPGLVLAVAVGAISAAAVLFRLAEGVHPIAAALWRTGSVGLLAPAPPRRRAGPDGTP